MHLKRQAAIYSFYLAVAVIITWPLVTVFGSAFVGHPFGDSLEYARHIWWIRHALSSGQPLFDQPMLAYPDGLNGAWLWATPLQSFPAWLLTFVMPLPAAFNLVALLRLALNGWAMCLLMDHLLGRHTGPALLAGLIFMIHPTFQGQLAAGHIGLLALWPVPLYVFALLRLADGQTTHHVETQHAVSLHRNRWFWLAVLMFVLSALGSPVLLVFVTGPVTVFLLLRAISRRDWQLLRSSLLVVLLGSLLVALFLLPVLFDPDVPQQGGVVRFSADLLALVTPSYQHPLFGQLAYTHRILGQEPFERMAYAGIVAAVLALVGVWRERQARGWLVLAAVMWLLSLGPLLHVLDAVAVIDLGDHVSYITLPWLALGELPFLNIVRTPARFNFTLALALAVMAGYGTNAIRDSRLRWAIIGVLALVVVFEYQSFWPMPTVDAAIPPAVEQLRERDDIRAVMNVPWSHVLAQKEGMYLQTGHQQPLLAGYITRRTPVDPAKLTVLEQTLNPALLDREGVDILIWHKAWARPDASDPRDRWGGPMYEDDRIAVFEVPDSTTSPEFAAAVSGDRRLEDDSDSYVFAPEPGWVTLAGDLDAHERRVTLALNGESLGEWQGDTLALPLSYAGYHTITLAVEPPCPGHPLPSLTCRAVDLHRLSLSDFVADTFAAPVMFERGVQLRGDALVVQGESLAVRLWWAFDHTLDENMVRFVHVLGSDGSLAAQDDQPYTGHAVEQIAFDSLPAGTYDVYTGWYSLPEVTRLAVQGAESGWVYLGQVEVEE